MQFADLPSELSYQDEICDSTASEVIQKSPPVVVPILHLEELDPDKSYGQIYADEMPRLDDSGR